MGGRGASILTSSTSQFREMLTMEEQILWGDQHYEEWLKNLSLAERRGILEYTTKDYETINFYLRKEHERKQYYKQRDRERTENEGQSHDSLNSGGDELLLFDDYDGFDNYDDLDEYSDGTEYFSEYYNDFGDDYDTLKRMDPLALNHKQVGILYDHHIANIDAALNRARTPEPITVFRGATTTGLEKIANAMKDGTLPINGILTSPSYNSTTLNKTVADGFSVIGGEAINIRIDIPKGAPGAYVSHSNEDLSLGLGSNPDGDSEQEFLLPRGTKFRVKGYRTEPYQGHRTKYFLHIEMLVDD